MGKSSILLGVVLGQFIGLSFGHFSRAQAAEETVFFVVRHADKLNETDDSPLSEAGKKRAQQLMQTLRNLRIDAIYHTKYVRSVKTAEPLASKLHITPTEYGDGNQSLQQWAADLLTSQKGKRTLIVGHSGTVEQIVEKLSGIHVDPISGYDNLFIVVVSDQHKSMVRLKYGAATN